MIDSEILQKLQGASVEERIRVIEAISRSLNSIQSPITRQLPSEPNPLKGKVICYDCPYESVVSEDW